MPTTWILAQVFIFIGILIFYPHFLQKINFTLRTKNTHTQDLKDKNVHIETH